MRIRTPIAFGGLLIIVLGGLIGSAAFSTDTEPPPTTLVTAEVPATADARVAAAAFAAIVQDPAVGGSAAGSTTALGSVDVADWRPLVATYFPLEHVDEALAIIECVSGGDPALVDPATGAAGLFQLLPSTWERASEAAGRSDASPLDAEENTAVAAWLVERSTADGVDPWSRWSCTP